MSMMLVISWAPKTFPKIGKKHCLIIWVCAIIRSMLFYILGGKKKEKD